MTQINYKSLLFLFFVCISLILIISNPIKTFYPAPTDDETRFYQPAVQGMQEKGIIEHLIHTPDTKPLPFMYVEYLLGASIFYTRILNYILIAVTTLLIYKLTGSKLAIFYPLIPIFLNGSTLTAEIIKAMFLIASLYYIRYSGIFIGLATIFNPFSILYGAMLNKKNLMYLIIIGEVFAGILLITGLFFPYLYWLIQYENLNESHPIDYLTIALLGMFIIIGSKNKTILKYALLSTIPILSRPYFAHYYIVTITVLFVGYLLEIKQKKL